MNYLEDQLRIYPARLKTDNYEATKKIVLVK